MSDLIRREDALKAVDMWESDWKSTDSAIRAISAVQPAHVNKTPKSEHDTANMLTLTAERDRFRKVLERVASLMHDEYNPYSIEGMLGDAARAALKGESHE